MMALIYFGLYLQILHNMIPNNQLFFNNKVVVVENDTLTFTGLISGACIVTVSGSGLWSGTYTTVEDGGYISGLKDGDPSRGLDITLGVGTFTTSIYGVLEDAVTIGGTYTNITGAIVGSAIVVAL